VKWILQSRRDVMARRKQKVRMRTAKVKSSSENKIVKKIIIFSIRIFLICCLLYGLNFGFKFFAKKMNFFNIKKVSLQGLNILRADCFTPDLKYLYGKNIFSDLMLKSSIKNIRHKFYEIENIKIIKCYPNKILIKIQERIPIARINIGSKSYLMDRHGVFFEDRFLNKKFLEIDSALVQDRKHLKEVIDFLFMVLRSKYRLFISEMKFISYDNMSSINVELKNGIKIFFGKINNENAVNTKFNYLWIVWKDLYSKKIFPEKIDLRNFSREDQNIIVKKKLQLSSQKQ
jgi:cell division septal protein FtsQ